MSIIFSIFSSENVFVLYNGDWKDFATLVILSVTGFNLQSSSLRSRTRCPLTPVFLMLSMKYEKAAINTLIEDSAILFGFVVDIFYFQIPITLSKIIGSAIIIVTCLTVTLSKSSA